MFRHMRPALHTVARACAPRPLLAATPTTRRALSPLADAAVPLWAPAPATAQHQAVWGAPQGRWLHAAARDGLAGTPHTARLFAGQPQCVGSLAFASSSSTFRKGKVKVKAKAAWPKFNNDVTADTVRLLDREGEQIGIMSLEDAKEYASARRHDLVQFSAQNEPVVCKVLDWAGEKRRARKVAAQRRRENRPKNVGAKPKRIRFTARIEENDLQVKMRKISQLLSKGHMIMVSVGFQGLEPWRSQEVKRRGVLLALMDGLGEDTVQWVPSSLKADQFSLYVTLQPLNKETAASRAANADVRAKLQEPIWPANMAKAEAALKAHEDKAAKAASSRGGRSSVPDAAAMASMLDDDDETDGSDDDDLLEEELGNVLGGSGRPPSRGRPKAVDPDADELLAGTKPKPKRAPRRRRDSAAASLVDEPIDDEEIDHRAL